MVKTEAILVNFGMHHPQNYVFDVLHINPFRPSDPMS